MNSQGAVGVLGVALTSAAGVANNYFAAISSAAQELAGQKIMRDLLAIIRDCQ